MSIKEILEYPLIETENFKFSVFNLILIILIFVSARLITSVMVKVMRRRFRNKKEGPEEGRRFAIITITRYAIFALAILLILANSGIDITVLVAGSTALLVGLGFGLQNLFKDFVCGVIMLFEGSLELNDIVDLGKYFGKVTYIGLRTSKILTPAGVTLIVPNSKFIEETVINLTKDKITTRYSVSVGVAYAHDPKEVEKVLLEVAKNHKMVARTPLPTVRLDDFGDNGVKFLLLFWTNQNFIMEDIRSEIRFAIFATLREHGITIPFPQRDLHIVELPRAPIPTEGAT